MLNRGDRPLLHYGLTLGFIVTLLLPGGTVGAAPVNRDVKSFGLEPFGQGHLLRVSRQTNIKNAFAGVAIKMAVLAHVGAKMRRTAVQSNLPDQPTLDQSVQAVIDCRHGNIRHFIFGSDKYLLSRRMIAFVQQNGVHMLALRSKTKTAARQTVV